AARFLLRQPVGVGPRQRLDERGLAVINVPRRPGNYVFGLRHRASRLYRCSLSAGASKCPPHSPRPQTIGLASLQGGKRGREGGNVGREDGAEVQQEPVVEDAPEDGRPAVAEAFVEDLGGRSEERRVGKEGRG